VALISADVVDPESAAPGSCDLAVVVDPDERTLRVAAGALRPGASLYGEWYGMTAGRRTSIVRRLRAAGLHDARSYLAWPPPRRAPSSFWIPLDVDAPGRYLLSRRPHGGRARSFTRPLAHRLWASGLRVGLAPLVCIVARRVGSGEGHDGRRATPEIGWNEDELGPLPADLAWLLLTGGGSSINKVAAFGFAPGDGEPRLVVKLARVARSERALKHEAAALRALHASRPGGVAGAPRPLALTSARGTTALGETLIAGTPLYTQLSRDTYEDLAWRGTRWLVGLATGSRAIDAADWRERLVEAPLDRFERTFGPVLDRGRFDRTRAALERLPSLALIPEQRDFSPWNVLLTPDGRLGVLDWESAESKGLPLLDLVYFLAHLSVFRDAAPVGSQRSSYDGSLDPSTTTGRVTRACTDYYLAEVGIPPEAEYPLRLLTWIIHTRSEYDAMQGEGSEAPGPSALRRSTFLGFWEASVEHP
jgi:aminoglycoside phosphotransferase (APT) family kinase protein